jgi:hypothetical protein
MRTVKKIGVRLTEKGRMTLTSMEHELLILQKLDFNMNNK